MGRDTQEASFFDRQRWFSMASLQEKAPCSKRTCTVPLYHRTTIRPIFPSTICTAAEILSTRHPRYHASSQTPLWPLCLLCPLCPLRLPFEGLQDVGGMFLLRGVRQATHRSLGHSSSVPHVLDSCPRVLVSSRPHVQCCVVDDDAALSHITASVATTPFLQTMTLFSGHLLSTCIWVHCSQRRRRLHPHR